MPLFPHKRMDKNSTNQPFGHLLLPVLMLLTVSLSLCSCRSYINAIPPLAATLQSCTQRNPLLIFDTPTPRSCRLEYLPSELFTRPPWPVARTPQGYITYGETMSYVESLHDNQYIDSRNIPRQNLHRRIRGYRSHILFR